MNKILVNRESEDLEFNYLCPMNLGEFIAKIQNWRTMIPDNATMHFYRGGYDDTDYYISARWTEEETDEEFEKRKKALKAMAEESEFARWQLYNQLKKEFEK